VANWWRKQDTVVPEADEATSDCHVETSSMLQEAMARLPDQQRLIIWLREVEGQSYEELAGVLEIPLGTVRSRLFAAREALRRIWFSEQRQKEVSDEMR
jgi:RNA polymerase sigma-70 factor (ECF subfamily)